MNAVLARPTYTPEEATVTAIATTSLHRVRGIDLLAFRVGLALLHWSRRRDSRLERPHDVQQRMLAAQRAAETRDRAAALLAARVR